MKCCLTCFHNKDYGSRCSLGDDKYVECLDWIPEDQDKPRDHKYRFKYIYWELFNKTEQSEPIDFTIDKSLDRFDF